MQVNGAKVTLNDNNLTIAAFLKQGGFAIDRVAVEVNGEIIPKNTHDTVILKEGDNVEIVSFIGGG